MVKRLRGGGAVSRSKEPDGGVRRVPGGTPRAGSGETGFLETLRTRVRLPKRTELALGIGDDCAIFRPRGASEDLLFTTDLLVEGVHFRRETHSARDAGWKALARGLSDIAAMGGEPRFCLLSLAAAPWSKGRWLRGFYDGLLELADAKGIPLAGGDLGHAENFVCDIVVCGAVARGQALLRSGAHVGDAIYVSGRLGVSALGLETQRGAAWRRHKRPEPRLALGRALRQRFHATSAMDLSDGLSLDLRRLAAASSLAAGISMPPVWPGATAAQALHGGEDYELLFTAPAETRMPAAFQGLALTRIGTMRKGRPGAVRLDDAPLPALGYDHFRL